MGFHVPSDRQTDRACTSVMHKCTDRPTTFIERLTTLSIAYKSSTDRKNYGTTEYFTTNPANVYRPADRPITDRL